MAEALTGKVCPKCAYKRTATETAPDWQCPKCGVAYAKAAAAAGGGAPAGRPASASPYAAPTAPVVATVGAARIAPSGFIEAVVAGLKGYVDFGGRATRAEYWWFILFWFIALAVSGYISEIAGMVVWLGLLLPNLAVSVRRLHDIGKSGWWYLIILVPLFGALIMLYWAVQPSDGNNDYGVAAA